MEILTRAKAIENLRKYEGQDLRVLAKLHGITSYETGRQNKGWKGQVLEKLAGLECNVRKAPNGLSFELKSVSFLYKDGLFVPKETMAIGMINPDELKAHEFFQSHHWAKLKSMIFCAILWEGKNAEKAILTKVTSIDFLETDKLILEVKADYDFIRHKLITQGFGSLTGKDGKWIQARTKGAGHGSTSRAFYAKTIFLREIFKF